MPRGKQRQRVVDDEDDIEQGSGQKSGSVTVKKHPGQQSTAGQEHSEGHENQAPQSDEDVEEDDEDEQRRQEEMNELIENFTDQPLPSSDKQQVLLLGGSWDSLARNWEGAYETFKNTAILLEGELPESNGKEIQKLDASFRTLIDAEAAIAYHREALSLVAAHVGQSIVAGSAKELYNKEVKKGKVAYEAKTTRQKYATHELYGSFREDIWSARHPDEPMDPLINSMPREEGDEEEEDDDFQVGGTTQDLRCPLTLTFLVDPVTSKKCKHSFSRSSINEYLQSQPKECPATGCKQIIFPSDLEPNRGLAFKVKARLRREKEKAEANENIEIDNSDEG